MVYGWLSKLCCPFGSLDTRCRIILRTQRATIVLTTTHMLGHAGFLPSAVPSRLLCCSSYSSPVEIGYLL